MIRINKGESFPILVSLVDDFTGDVVSGQLVTYDIRTIDDDVLNPPVSGTLIESSFEPGIYKSMVYLSNPGNYIVYAKCSGFVTSTEEIVVNEDNIYELIKQDRYYNISVESVIRLNQVPTASQISRNVSLNNTDYIVTRIKKDDDLDWSSTTVSGVVYAHYISLDDTVPYKMAGPF